MYFSTNTLLIWYTIFCDVNKSLFLFYCPISLLPLELGGATGSMGGAGEVEPRLSHTPSLLENALSQESGGGGASDGTVSHAPWPAAPDITRETRNSLRDNGLGDWWGHMSTHKHMQIQTLHSLVYIPTQQQLICLVGTYWYSKGLVHMTLPPALSNLPHYWLWHIPHTTIPPCEQFMCVHPYLIY